MFPPSPALSELDSLAGIEDLDAFLDAQGKLSHFPTPPLRLADLEPAFLADSCNINSQYRQAAYTFASTCSGSENAPSEHVNSIHDVLLQADLPREMLAIAYNIFTATQHRRHELGEFTTTLLIVAALSLSVSYTDDHPRRNSWWSRHVCRGAYTPRNITDATTSILILLDWRLHELSSPERVEQAMTLLTSAPPPDSLFRDVRSSPLDPCEQQRLKIYVESTRAYWQHGQLTPEDGGESRMHSPYDADSPSLDREDDSPSLRFLPLL